MPLQNRVSPEGSLHAVPKRGTLMGNRGILHEGGEIRHVSRTQGWVACQLVWKGYKGGKRPLMQPGHYTELFFLDEATAYAAGHRPCAQCRNADYKAFVALWTAVHGAPALPVSKTIDATLHAQRLDGKHQRRWTAEAEGLPDGTMILVEGAPVLLWRGARAWSFGGYTPCPRPTGPVTVLTPPAVVELLRAGLKVQVHPSAG